MTWRRAPRVAAWISLLAPLACAERPAPAPSSVSLGGHAARVGDVTIPASLVGGVAGARGVTARETLDGLVRDALLAQGAKARGLEDEPSVRWACTTTVARLVPDRLVMEARAEGAPVDEELATVEVIHAVVLRAPTLAPVRASAIAGQILQAVATSRDDADFRTRAEQVPHVGTQVTVERLAAFDASGQDDRGATVDLSFAAAAFALHEPGKTSPVVETPFGWHVIRLIRRVVPAGDLLEARRRDLAEAVVEMRVRTRLASALREERQRQPVDTSAAADALMTEAVAGAL
jgi:PPIC-type PPIASE domain